MCRCHVWKWNCSLYQLCLVSLEQQCFACMGIMNNLYCVCWYNVHKIVLGNVCALMHFFRFIIIFGGSYSNLGLCFVIILLNKLGIILLNKLGILYVVCWTLVLCVLMCGNWYILIKRKLDPCVSVHKGRMLWQGLLFCLEFCWYLFSYI
jgi:hypothetical protein